MENRRKEMINGGDTIKQSFSEVYDIIMHMEKEMINKIPNNFIDLIKNNRDLRL